MRGVAAIPLKELRVVPINTAVAPAPSSLTDCMILGMSRDSYVKTQTPSGISRRASTDAAGVDIILRALGAFNVSDVPIP